jgi:hypothetical protein
MKNKRTTYSGVVLTLLLSGFLLFQGCESSRVGPDIPRPNPPAPPAAPIILTGQVINSASGAGIGGALVALTTTGGLAITSTITNSSGLYSFDVSDRTETQLAVNILAEGYGFTTRMAILDLKGRTIYVAPAYLTRLVTVTVTATPASGGSSNTTSSESVGGTTLKMAIPPNAVSTNTNVTLASVPGNNTPPVTNSSAQNDISTASLTPLGVQFLQPVTLTFPLPYPLPQGTEISIIRLNPATNNWDNTTLKAIVDATTLAAVTQVTQTGQYSLLGGVGVNQQGAGSYLDGDVSIKVEELSKSMNPEAEVLVTLKSGTQTINLPFGVTRTLTASSGVNVSDVFLANLLAKILNLSFGTYNVPYSFSFPGIPAAYIRNGVQFNPNNPNEAGEWEYRVYMVDVNSTAVVIVSHPGVFSRTYNIVRRTWVSDTARSGWYWVAHNQGGVAQGPF